MIFCLVFWGTWGFGKGAPTVGLQEARIPKARIPAGAEEEAANKATGQAKAPPIVSGISHGSLALYLILADLKVWAPAK